MASTVVETPRIGLCLNHSLCSTDVHHLTAIVCAHQELVTDSESAVNNHLLYVEAFSQCHELERLCAEKLQLCVEPSADRHSLQVKLERIQVSEC